MRRLCRPVIALLLLAASVAAADPADPAAVIGMDPAQAWAALGAPASIYAQRGAVAAEDDVVFFYPDGRYVFWFGNRIWQVSFDGRYAGSVLGFAIGMTRAEAVAAAGGRLRESEGTLYLSFDAGRFPLAVRLALDGDRVAGVTVYRSDW